MGGKLWGCLHGLKTVGLMVVVQVCFAGVNVFYKLAIDDGMSLRILVAYRYIFAAAFLSPLALFLERKKRPPLTWKVLILAFACGLFGGTLAQNLYIGSLAMVSATFAAAMTNLIPAITFVMAVVFGMERLRIRSPAGRSKVIGTMVGISGAMLLTFYKGVELRFWPSGINLLKHKSTAVAAATAESGNRVMGSLLAVASCFCYAIWLIIQTKLGESYPCHYSSTALMSLMGSIQAVVYALCMEKDASVWKLGWNLRLITVVYTGVFASGVSITLIAWAIKRKGPLYVSIFNPVMLVVVAIAGSLLLDERLHLGSVLGAVLIVIGLYLVLWGKGKEMGESVHLSVRSGSGRSVGGGGRGSSVEAVEFITSGGAVVAGVGASCDETDLQSKEYKEDEVLGGNTEVELKEISTGTGCNGGGSEADSSCSTPEAEVVQATALSVER